VAKRKSLVDGELLPEGLEEPVGDEMEEFVILEEPLTEEAGEAVDEKTKTLGEDWFDFGFAGVDEVGLIHFDEIDSFRSHPDRVVFEVGGQFYTVTSISHGSRALKWYQDCQNRRKPHSFEGEILPE